MSLDWSLKELYPSFESEAFKNDLQEVDIQISNIIEWVKEATNSHQDESSKLEAYLKLSEKFDLLTERLSVFIELTMSTDSKNESAIRYDAIMQNKLNQLAKSQTLISRWISEIENLEALIQESSFLQEYAFCLKEIVEENKHLLSEDEEAIIAKMRNTGSTAWTNYKNLLISMHKVEIELNGKKQEMPLTQLLNLAYEKDANKRRLAYEAEIASYQKIEDGLAAALNGIKGEVLTTCELRGYLSPLEMTLKQSRMKQETLDAMIEAIKESLPDFRRYLRRKAELLGHSNGLPFYDLYAPVIDKEMTFSYEEGKAFVEKNFRSFSAHLGDYAKKAFERNWLDVFPKEGKRSGAFCENILSIKESRILLNYGNALGDVITMAHELGHGFHGECLAGQSILNANYPMPLAETASTFCETIVKKAAIKEASKEEAFAILETEIGDANQVIVDIYSRFLFESSLFERRKESPLSVEEIKELMLKAQKESYGDGLDQAFLHPYMWTWKPHYYYASSNFYNFPYAFGLLFAKGLYAQYLQDTEGFPAKYEKLLAVTGKMSIEDAASTMNIDVSSIAFWRSSLAMVKEDIDAFISLSQEIKNS